MDVSLARDAEEFRKMAPNPITIAKKHTGEVVVKEAAMGRVDLDNGPKSPDDEPMSMQLRSVFHQMLYRQIMKLGIQVTCGKREIEFSEDESKAYVLTYDQQHASADVILASDGVGSKAQQIVNGGKVEAKSSGTGMFRASCMILLLWRHLGWRRDKSRWFKYGWGKLALPNAKSLNWKCI